MIRSRPSVLTGMAPTWFVPVMVPYHEDPDSPQRSLAYIQYMLEPLRLPEYRGRDLADWKPEFRTVHLPSQSPGSWWSPLRLSAWTFNCIIIIPVPKVHIVKEGNILRCYNLQYTLEPCHWHIYNKFKETALNWLIMFLMMTVIVRFHGIIRWMQANSIWSS